MKNSERIDIQWASSRRPRPPDSELGFGKVFTDHMFVMDYDGGRWQKPRVVPYGPLSLDPSTSAFHYGQAMFEGMKAFRGKDGKIRVFRVEKHANRMKDGAQRLCMPSLDPEDFREALFSVISVDQDWVPGSPGTALYIRPTLIATDPQLGVRASSRYTFFIILSPVGPYWGTEGLKPLKIWVEDRYVRAAKGGVGAVKAAGNYATSLLASEEAKKRGYAQVLWLDAAGHRTLEEVGTMNVFLKIGDEVITPPLEGTILAGVTRDSVLALLRGWGMKVSERRVSLDEVQAAARSGTLREVFGCGTAAVISPVGELGWAGGSISVGNGQVGDLTRKLYETIQGIQHGQLPDQYGWLSEVPTSPVNGHEARAERREVVLV